jgi:hypothetical protein
MIKWTSLVTVKHFNSSNRSTSTVPMYDHPEDAPPMFLDPELVHAAEVVSKSQSSKRQQQQQQQQHVGSGKPSISYPITSGAR